MNLYKLSFVMHGPGEETEDKFMAEIPALPGCRAWGDTAVQALEHLQSVATAFIESYKEMGDKLPLERGLDDLEDYYLAMDVLECLRQGKEQVYSAAQVRQSLDLDDTVHLSGQEPA